VKWLIRRLADELLHKAGSAKFQRYSQALDLSLEYLKGSSAETELVVILSNSLGDDDANVRYRAAQSLGQLGQATPEAVEALMGALGDGYADVRYRATESLGQLGQAAPKVVQVLLDGAHLAPSWSTRRDYINLVGKIGKYDQQTVDVLLMGFTDQDNGVRAACAQALARLGQRNPEAVEEIAQHTNTDA